MCLHCRYYNDRFTLISKLTSYLEQEPVESLITRRAAQKAKRLERNRRMEGKHDDF